MISRTPKRYGSNGISAPKVNDNSELAAASRALGKACGSIPSSSRA